MTLVTRKWTREEFEKLSQVGLLAEDERVELIRGEIVALSPIDPLHAITVDRATMLLVSKFGNTHVVRVQNPILVGDDSQPQPDLVLILQAEARELARQRRHPAQVDLVIEVANTSLAYDRTEKASLYAAAGLAPYWIVNLVQEVLEVYSDPSPDSSAVFGWSYSSFHRLSRGQSVEFAGRTIPVIELLPPAEE